MLKRFRIVGLCLVAVFAVSAVGAASASAAKPKTKFCVKVEFGEPSSWEAGCGAVGVGWAKVVPSFRQVSLIKWCGKVEDPLTEEGAWEDNKCTIASGTGKYIKFDVKVEGKNPNVFTGSSAATSVLETKKAGLVARKVECKKEESKGEATGESTVGGIVVTFKECKGPLSSTCTSAGAGSGEIVTNSLKGEFVYISEGAKTVGQELQPETSGGLFAEFVCKGSLINETLKVKGTLLGEVPSAQLNEMRSSFEVNFKQTKGTEEPTEYEEGGTKIKTKLETEGSGTENFAYEESGQATKETITPEELSEIVA